MHDKDYLVGIAIRNVGFTIRRRRNLDLAMLREKRKKYEQLDLEGEKGEIRTLEVLDLPVLVLKTPPLPGGGSC